MSKQSTLVKNTLIIAVGKLSTQFLSFFLIPVYTIFLSPSEFGQIDIIMTYLSILAPTLTVQMEMAVFRHLIEARGDKHSTARVVSSSSAVLFTGALLGIVLIAILGTIFNLSYTVLLVGVFVSAVIASYLFQVARGIGRNDLFAIVSIITGLINIVGITLSLMVFKMGIEGILSVSIIANTSGIIILSVSTSYYKILRRRNVSPDEIQALLNYSWPLVPNHISLWGISGISRTIVVAILGFASMGILATGTRFSMIYTSIYSIFAMSWTEAVSVHIQNDKDDFISKTTDVVARFFGSLTIIIIAFVGLVFPLLVSVEFADARLFIPILLIGAFLTSLVTHYGAIYLAVRKTKEIAIITLQALVISSVFTIALIGLIGLYAPALAIVITYGYLVIRRHIDVQRFVSIRYNKYTFPTLILVSGITVSLYYLNNIYASVAAIVFATLCFLALNRGSITLMMRMVIGKLNQSKKS